MEHLTHETLARLVDESPRPEEAEHLGTCPRCRMELDALRAQTQMLATLPEIRPPLGDWEVLEARMRSEGLIEDPGLFTRLSLARTPPWMRAAAAVAIFVAGGALGAGLTARDLPGGLGAPGGSEGGPAVYASLTDLGDAADAVAAAERNYMAALAQYRRLLEQDGEVEAMGDPRSRYAALEYLVAAGQAAVRQAPADPFLNGLLASTLAEREAALRRISNRQDNWF